MDEQFKYVIIGAGLAGASAVEGIREVDQSGSIALFGNEPYLPYDRPPLSKGLWTGKSKELEIRVHDMEFYRSHGVRFFRDTSIVVIRPKSKKVLDTPGNAYTYSQLLIATGGAPRRLPFGNGVLRYYRTLDNYKALREEAGRRQDFLVIGGGFIGAELAASLTMNGKKVTLLMPDEYLLARILPPGLGRYVLEYCRSKGMTVIAGDSATAAERTGDRIAVTTRGGKRLEADVAIAAIGIQPGVDLAREAGLQVSDGITVSPDLQTSDPSIYAAGDVASFPSPSLDETIRIEHWDNARAMGKQAGRNMAGAGEPYSYLPYFWTDIFDLGCEAVGKLDSRLTVFCDWKDENKEGVVYYLDGNRVKGVLLWNVWEKVDAARKLIESKKSYANPRDLRGRI
jgi:3-phenylpropionate/trans-cinnamate dioxygenase ferredoxin reductase component